MKLVYITGATKGTGRATAITFANAGWDLILLSRNLDKLKKLKAELSYTKSKINLVKCDLNNSKEIENSIDQSIERYGCLPVLINNSGHAFNDDLVGMSLDDWQ